MKNIFNSLFNIIINKKSEEKISPFAWRESLCAKELSKPRVTSLDNDLRTTAIEPEVAEEEQKPLQPARIDFWSYSMRELEGMYFKLFGVHPVHKSKEQLVEALITGRIC